MTTTKPPINESSNAAGLPNAGEPDALLRRAQHFIRSYPLYTQIAARLTLCAAAGLVMLSSSYFLADYSSRAHANVNKIANVRRALAAPGSDAAHAAGARADVEALVAPLIADEAVRQSSAKAVAFILAARSSSQKEAASIQLQHAQQAIADEAGVIQSVFKWLEFTCFAGMLYLMSVSVLDLRPVLTGSSERTLGLRPKQGIATDGMSFNESGLRLQARAEGRSGDVTDMAALLARVMRAHDYLTKTITSTIEPPFRTSMLRKMLFALERALDLENAAILFSEDSAREPSERCLFSHHEPRISRQQLGSAVLASAVEMPAGSNGLSATGVGFVDHAGETSMLLAEYKRDRALKPFEVQTLRMTAGLLSIIAKLDGHDQEARRVALLEERAVIARELHDSLAQSLSYMKIQLARLQTYQANSETDNIQQIHDVTRELRQGLDNAYKELRGLLSTFRVHMDARGLDCAIESAIEEFTQRSGVPVALDNRLMGVPLTVNEEFHVLQVVREALSNILHHASARSVSVVMAQHMNKCVTITVDDDGVGYSPSMEGQTAHHGHTIMKERAFNLGGLIDIAPRPDAGTRVKLTFTPKKSQ